MGGLVLAGPPRHRRYSDEQKIAIVGESYLPGVLVRDVMARYGLASSLIYTWRKQAREGRLGGGAAGVFAPVAIVEPQVREPEQEPEAEVTLEAGEAKLPDDGASMVVALPDGVRILVNSGVDEDALGRVLRALAQVPAPARSHAR